MGQGRFVNQKLGKRTSRKVDLLKSQLRGNTNPPLPRGPAKPSCSGRGAGGKNRPSAEQ